MITSLGVPFLTIFWDTAPWCTPVFIALLIKWIFSDFHLQDPCTRLLSPGMGMQGGTILRPNRNHHDLKMDQNAQKLRARTRMAKGPSTERPGIGTLRLTHRRLIGKCRTFFSLSTVKQLIYRVSFESVTICCSLATKTGRLY